MAHPGVESEELRSITPPDAHDYFWAESTRVPDLEALCSPDVRKVIEKRGIEAHDSRVRMLRVTCSI